MYTAAAIPTGLVGMHSDRPPGNDYLCSEQLPFKKVCVGEELNQLLSLECVWEYWSVLMLIDIL